MTITGSPQTVGVTLNVLAAPSLTAGPGSLTFNVATGSRLWATDEFTSFAFFKIFGRAAVTRNGHFDLEWRDARSNRIDPRASRDTSSFEHADRQ